MQEEFSFSWKTGLFKNHRIHVAGNQLVYSSKHFFNETKDTFDVSSLDNRESIYTENNFRGFLVGAAIAAFGGYWLYLALATDEAKGDKLANFILGVVACFIIAFGAGLFEYYLHISGKFHLISFRYSGQGALSIAKKKSIELSVARLRNHISQHTEIVTSNDASLTDQLQKLAELFDGGYLTIEEFKMAKEKIVNPFY